MDYHVADDGELGRYLWKANALLARANQPPLTLDQLRPAANQLRCVIDILHLNGIAVLFDLVFNHAGPGFNDQSISSSTVSHTATTTAVCISPTRVGRRRHIRILEPGCPRVPDDNVEQCLEEFHIDGIRYDEVTVIDRNGGGRCCQDATGTARFIRPRAIQIAEYWADDRAAAVRPAPSGLGFDAAWGDRLRDGIRTAIRRPRRA